MKIEFFVKTDPGKVRKENQDFYGISTDENLFFVCDGMGGHTAGDFASVCASKIILKSYEFLSKKDFDLITSDIHNIVDNNIKKIVGLIRLANRAIWHYSEEYPLLKGMGTTIVSAYFDKENSILNIFNVGDSRIYRVRNSKIELLTKDHSKLNELLEQGKIKESEIKTSEIQSMITRALGILPKVKIDVLSERVLSNDIYILCSDGLNSELEDKDIKDIAMKYSDNVSILGNKLIDAANNAGGRDNITVLVIRTIGEDYKQKDILPLTTIEEASDKEERYIEKTLKKILKNTDIIIPKAVRKQNILFKPLPLATIITLLVFSIASFFYGKSKNSHSTKLQDLAGKISGIKLEVRIPISEQIIQFREAEDNIQKLQIVQDWKKNKYKYTVSVENVDVVVFKDNVEQLRAKTTNIPLEIKLLPGNYTFKFKYLDYRIVDDRLQNLDELPLNIELSDRLPTVDVIMVPSE